MNDHEIADVVMVLRREMLVDCADDEFDVSVDDETGAIELATDDWTLQLEGVPEHPIAWFAIDNEPDSAADYPAARYDALRSVEEAALRRANVVLDDLLALALEASGDQFSGHVAGALRGEAG